MLKIFYFKELRNLIRQKYYKKDIIFIINFLEINNNR